MFAIFNLAFIPIVYFLYPETANRSLEDLNEFFDADSGHGTIIRISDKVAKQHARPAEAIEAEQRRIASALESETSVKKRGVKIDHIEDLGN
jgi:hypothetical protein